MKIITIVLLPFSLFTNDLLLAQSSNDNLQLERFEQALELIPDINNGRKLYRLCVTCHGPEGWGSDNGSYPQIAGQLPTVTIKQLGDICSKQRGNPIMEAFTTPSVLRSAQDVADLSSYIAQLPMTADNGKGFSHELEQGSEIYSQYCSDCHGEKGEGNEADQIPRLQGQHYNYLMRQFSWIRNGHRGNADKKMTRQIQKLKMHEQSAVMSFVANLSPPERNLAKPGWINPDFPNHQRLWTPTQPLKK